MHANTKKMVTAALLAAFTCISTMVIKIQTPTFGYIHLGDGLVLLCGILMGPAAGALAAGIGSMLADIFSGYASFAPATLIIKALTAFTAGFLFHKLTRRLPSGKARRIGVLASGLPAEAVMTAGYFLYEAGLAAISSGGFTKPRLPPASPPLLPESHSMPCRAQSASQFAWRSCPSCKRSQIYGQKQILSPYALSNARRNTVIAVQTSPAFRMGDKNSG